MACLFYTTPSQVPQPNHNTAHHTTTQHFTTTTIQKHIASTPPCGLVQPFITPTQTSSTQCQTIPTIRPHLIQSRPLRWQLREATEEHQQNKYTTQKNMMKSVADLGRGVRRIQPTAAESNWEGVRSQLTRFVEQGPREEKLPPPRPSTCYSSATTSVLGMAGKGRKRQHSFGHTSFPSHLLSLTSPRIPTDP